MTKAQARKLAVISRRALLRGREYLPEDRQARYEYKTFEVSQFDDCPLVFVLAEVGAKGDEGTAAQVFCRDRYQFSIGPRGGLTLMNPARFVKRNGETRKTYAKGYVRGMAALNTTPY